MDQPTLYQLENCPYSHKVRHALTAHQVSYRLVNVPQRKQDRAEMQEAVGSRSVPAMVIDGKAYTSTTDILEQIARRWPADVHVLGHTERASAPVLIGVCPHHDVGVLRDALAEQLRSMEIRLVDAPLVDARREVGASWLEGGLFDELLEMEPRLAAMLPLRVAFIDHPNGLSAQLVAPHIAWMHFRNDGLNARTTPLQDQLAQCLSAAAAATNLTRNHA